MTPDQITAMFKALENEYKAGNISMWNYKTKLSQVFDLITQLAQEHADLTRRVEALEKTEILDLNVVRSTTT